MTDAVLLDPVNGYALWAQAYPAHAHNPVMQAEERAMLALLAPALQTRRVLDAGCGSGRYLLHALRRGAKHVAGIDLSRAMLQRAGRELLDGYRGDAQITLAQGDLTALPVPDAWADVTLSGLVIGHLEQLQSALAELRRVTRVGGTVLCSDVHPIGHALGWVRDFKAGGRRYAVRHTVHHYSSWHAACANVGLAIERVLEPRLDPDEIPAGARFDPMALEVPVAIVYQLKRTC